MRKRFPIKEMLKDPATRERMIEEATDFICAVEGITRFRAKKQPDGRWAVINPKGVIIRLTTSETDARKMARERNRRR